MLVARPKSSTVLLDHPQRLGILPSPWFWRDVENWKRIRSPFAMLIAVVIIVAATLVRNPLLAGVVGGGVIGLAQGLLERYIRREALQRRRDHDAAEGLLALASDDPSVRKPDC